MYPTWQQNGGVYWNPQMNMDPRQFCQTLTPEEATMLRQRGGTEFQLGITEIDRLKAICMHRDPTTGIATLEENPVDGSNTCHICGEKFFIAPNLSQDEVEKATNTMIDLLQTAKSLFLDMPAESAQKFFIIIAMIKKIPQLYKIAVENFARHEQAAGFSPITGNSIANMYNSLYSGFGNFGMGMGGMSPYMQQPNYGGFGMNPGMNPMPGMGMAQPQFGQQPGFGFGQPGMVSGAPPIGGMGGNPFGVMGDPAQAMQQQGFGQPYNPMGNSAPTPTPAPMQPQQAPAYQPSMTGFSYNPMNPAGMYTYNPMAPGGITPQAAAPQPAPVVAPQPQGSVPITGASQTANGDGTVTVNQQFKA